MGSSSLNAEVNAFERFRIVRRPEFLILWLEIQVMHRPGKVFGSFQSSLHERFVDDNLGRDIGQFATLPGLNLLAHRLEVPLHPINANRDAVDERERLRVFREHGSKHTRRNVSEFALPFRRCSGPYISWSAFYLCRPGLRFARGTGPRASSTTAA